MSQMRDMGHPYFVGRGVFAEIAIPGLKRETGGTPLEWSTRRTEFAFPGLKRETGGTWLLLLLF